MPVVLVTGFDAWGELSSNPSWNAVEAATPELPASWEIRKLRLPVSWEQAHQQLLNHWSDDVAAILAFGVAPRTSIDLEQIAINLVDPEARDVDGCCSGSDVVLDDGPTAYRSSLPMAEIHDALNQASIPVARSPHAGTYLCNHLFYHMMHRVTTHTTKIAAGFIHLPNPERTPELSPAMLKNSVEIAVATSCRILDAR